MKFLPTTFEINSRTKNLSPTFSKEKENTQRDIETGAKPPELSMKAAVNHVAGWGDGCSCYRMAWITQYMNDVKRARFNDTNATLFDAAYYSNFQTIRVQRYVSPIQTKHLEFLTNIQKKFKFRLIFDCDDIPFREDIPAYNYGKKPFEEDEIRKNAEENMLKCDTFTVCSEYMKTYFEQKIKHPNIVVVPDYLPKLSYDRFYSEEKALKRFEKFKGKPRILYAGSPMHSSIDGKTKDDFSEVVDYIIRTRKDFHWIFLGTIPYKLKPFAIAGEMEFHKWTSLLQYPYKMDSLNPSLVIAPLANNHFSCSKADIKFTESAALGIPGVFQDLAPYKDSLMKFSTIDSLHNNICKLTTDVDTFIDVIRKGREYVDKYRWLDDNLESIWNVYFG